MRRVVAALDDVASEYPRAVRNGAVLDPTRMRVLDTLLHDAQVFGSRFPGDERAALRELAVAVASHAASARVVDLARGLRHRLMISHQFVLAPATAPDRRRAAQLWSMLCIGCHGVTGLGDGSQGLSLEPEPKDFHDGEFISGLAPSRAFSQIAPSRGSADTLRPDVVRRSWTLSSATLATSSSRASRTICADTDSGARAP